MERIGLTALEEISFENVDGRTDDGSGELKTKKIKLLFYEISSL